METKKLVWASILGALTIVIDVFFQMIIPIQTMGTAYYAIPIVIAAIFLGPKYSIPIAFIGDMVSVLIAGVPFMPIFSIASTMWGIIPGFFLKGKKQVLKILIVVFITHLLVTSLNSFALYVHYHKTLAALLIDLPLRLLLVVPNTAIITILVNATIEPIELKSSFKISG